MFRKIRRIIDQWIDVPDRVLMLANRVGELRPYIPPSPPPPQPFVCMLIEGETETGEQRTCGMAAHAKNGRVLLEQTTNFPLRKIRVTVFCDLEQVQIHGIFRGIDLCTTALGICPTAYIDDWYPGQKICVQALVRDCNVL